MKRLNKLNPEEFEVILDREKTEIILERMYEKIKEIKQDSAMRQKKSTLHAQQIILNS